ncbi:MAG: hypothetical protein IJ839_07995 [Ruminobacter sp.]|nr:hypothetical protein [Ruminobacter sp.]
MKIIVTAPLWTKVLYAVGILMLLVGICHHFFEFPSFDPIYMPFFVIGGVSLMIPYQGLFTYEMLKYRPKD